MNNLECRKQGFNKVICKRTGKEIKLLECTNCPYKVYKTKNVQNSFYIVQNAGMQLKNNKTQKSKKISLKKRTNRLTKIERDRFSLFTEDLDHCIICGKSPVNKHEIFFGTKNRLNSIKYGLVIPLCTAEHHNQVGCTGIHFDKELRKQWQIKAQKKFQEVYPELDFLEIFGINYLK